MTSTALTHPNTITADTAGSGSLLTAADRCDACGAARAYVKAVIDVDFDGSEKSLLFCGHHWNRHKQAVKVAALAVHDETHLIPGSRRAPGTSAFS